MPFYFLKYLQPTQYFRLFTKFGNSVFPRTESMPREVLSNLIANDNYQSKLAQDYDLSWQAVINGFIGEGPVYNHFENVSVQDNYCFIRNYFHPAWVNYVFFIRMLSFHNPIVEFKGWFLTRKNKRSETKRVPIAYNEWQKYNSSLIQQCPKVSIIIPTLNRYKYLRAILTDLEIQDYKNFEVLVIDQSDDFDAAFYNDFKLDIQLLRQEEKALWLARNTGIRKSKGSFIALSEDDVRIESNWISNHIKCLDFFNCQVSAGVFYPEGQNIPAERSFFAVATQFATGNAMLYKSVFEQVGLFDRQFEKQRMGDGEFGLRVYLAGIRSVSNPFASCIDVKAATGGLREMGSWDAFRPSTFFAPRPIPSVLYYFRKYYGNSAARWALLRTVPLSIMPYQFKNNKLMMVLGVVVSLFLLPVVLFQVFTSWKQSSIKLNQGSLIDIL